MNKRSRPRVDDETLATMLYDRNFKHSYRFTIRLSGRTQRILPPTIIHGRESYRVPSESARQLRVQTHLREIPSNNGPVRSAGVPPYASVSTQYQLILYAKLFCAIFPRRPRQFHIVQRLGNFQALSDVIPRTFHNSLMSAAIDRTTELLSYPTRERTHHIVYSSRTPCHDLLGSLPRRILASTTDKSPLIDMNIHIKLSIWNVTNRTSENFSNSFLDSKFFVQFGKFFTCHRCCVYASNSSPLCISYKCVTFSNIPEIASITIKLLSTNQSKSEHLLI